jgi:hypothetical protein
VKTGERKYTEKTKVKKVNEREIKKEIERDREKERE